jgi:Flp pilus assembly protein TadD
VQAVPDPDTLAHLALQDLQKSCLAAAESKCLQALSVDRQHPLTLTVLGTILHVQGRHEDAVRVFTALTLLQPNETAHWENLGAALRPTRRHDEALAACSYALQLGLVSPNLLYNIGLVHIDRGDYDSGYGTLRRAWALAPRDAGIRCAFARCCHDMLRFEEVLASLEDWQRLDGLTPDIEAQIAYLLVMMGEPQSARSAIERISDNKHRGDRASLMLVRLLERVNRLPEARQAMMRLKATAQINAADPDLLLTGATLSEREGNHEEACRLLLLGLKDHGDFLRRHHLLFPLARSLDSLGRYQEAYAALDEAHRSQVAFLRAAMGGAPAGESGAMLLIQHSCDPDDHVAWEDPQAPPVEESPIFIVGFPRSGTTLLEQTLDAHPLLRSMDERPFLQRALDDVVDCGIHYPTELGRLSSKQLESIRAGYWKRVGGKVALQPGQRLVDKNPLNMLRLPLIRRLFPNARIVLATRHPCDTVLSCYQQHFRAPELALICRDLPTIAARYRRTFDFWYAQAPVLRVPTYELRYERLVANFETELRQLSSFLEIPWNDAMLSPGAHARGKGFISTPSYAQVVQPVSQKSVGRWKWYEPYFGDALSELTSLLKRWGHDHGPNAQ